MDYGCARWGDCSDYRGQTSPEQWVALLIVLGLGALTAVLSAWGIRRLRPTADAGWAILAGALAFWVPVVPGLLWAARLALPKRS